MRHHQARRKAAFEYRGPAVVKQVHVGWSGQRARQASAAAGTLSIPDRHAAPRRLQMTNGPARGLLDEERRGRSFRTPRGHAPCRLSRWTAEGRRRDNLVEPGSAPDAQAQAAPRGSASTVLSNAAAPAMLPPADRHTASAPETRIPARTGSRRRNGPWPAHVMPCSPGLTVRGRPPVWCAKAANQALSAVPLAQGVPRRRQRRSKVALDIARVTHTSSELTVSTPS